MASGLCMDMLGLHSKLYIMQTTYCIQFMPYCSNCSSNVAVHISLLSLHIIFLDQTIDILLDIAHTKHTSAHGGLDNFRHQLLVRDQLATLEDSHNGGLAFKVAVFCNADMSLLVFFLRLLQLHLIDLDTVFSMLKVQIYREGVCLVDVSSSGVFG